MNEEEVCYALEKLYEYGMALDGVIFDIASSSLDCKQVAAALFKMNVFHIDMVRTMLVDHCEQCLFNQSVNEIQKSEFLKGMLVECIVCAIVS